MVTSTSIRPGLILAHSDPAYTALVGHAFLRQGWEVFIARDGVEARDLARLLAPAAVVLEGNLEGESGWLTCDKLMREQSNLNVFLVATEDTPMVRRLASFVGAAAVLRRRDGVQRLLDEICTRRLLAAG